MQKVPVLKVKNLVKEYREGFKLEIPDVEFAEGKIYAITGPNGAGKTTLLNLLSLLEKPTRGEIFFRGRKAPASSPESIHIRRKMHLVMENPYLFHTTVYRNITAGLKIRNVEKNRFSKLVKEALHRVSLEGFEARPASTLSRGEMQRVVLARALVLQPEVLFLDEPFVNIDRRTREILEELIRGIKSLFPTTVIFTTHDLKCAYHLSDKVYSLLEGRLVSGSLENLFTGEVEKKGQDRFVKISPSLKISVVTLKEGKVHICIPPEDIVLSQEAFHSSARNSFRGIIKNIYLSGEVVKVSVEVGAEFTVLITRASYQNMHLAVGDSVCITFKSTAVQVF
ncbi:MAG: ABC transporter ATP-binding protein [Caldiserica bacterium]|nr:ABC transporter ATP-binding protein [Caldisericota bacterium]